MKPNNKRKTRNMWLTIAAVVILAGIAWTLGGWPAVCAISAVFGLAALLVDWTGGPE